MASLRAAAKLFSRNTAAAAQTMFAPPAALHMPVPGQKFTFASFARAVMMATPGKSTGVSKWFSVSKGYGFIVPDDGGPDLFVHQSNILAEGFRSLADGEPVEFVVDNSDVGRTKAVEVTGPDGSYVQGQPKQPFGGGRGHDDNGGGGDGGYGGGGYNQY